MKVDGRPCNFSESGRSNMRRGKQKLFPERANMGAQQKGLWATFVPGKD